jgi:hypothetical protein
MRTLIASLLLLPLLCACNDAEPTEQTTPLPTCNADSGCGGDQRCVEGACVPLMLSGALSAPDSVMVPETLHGAQRQELITITNSGGGPLQISAITLTDAAGVFSVSYPTPGAPDDPSADSAQPPTTLDAGAAATIRLVYAPTDGASHAATLRITSDDPSRPEHTIALTGMASAAGCALLEEEGVETTQLNLGQQPIGASVERTLRLRGCAADKPVTISALEIEGDGLSLLPSELSDALAQGTPLRLEAGESKSVVVGFTPTMVGTLQGALRVTLSGGAPLEVPVSAEVTACAPPIIELITSEGVKTDAAISVPISALQTLNAANVTATTKLEWSIRSKPTGSLGRFVPSATQRSPYLNTDIVGLYAITLKSTDASGASCGMDTLDLTITPNSAIYIELLSLTPADPIQQDEDSVVVELHLRHPDATAWNTSPWDIFAGNPTADWGVSGDASDDPLLKKDNPTLQHLELPIVEADTRYQVGVHYREDPQGFGLTYITANVYLDGALVGQRRDKILQPGEFFHMGELNTQDGSFLEINQTTMGFPQP